MSRTIRGQALLTALVFLSILTIVGIFALKNTALEIMMSANNSKGIQAFEASEAARVMTSKLIDAHFNARGWPVKLGGSIENDRFPTEIPEGLTLGQSVEGNGPRNWFEGEFQNSSSFVSMDFGEVDSRYQRNISGRHALGFMLQGNAVVRSLRKDIQAGSSNAISSGYEGLGNGAATGGANIFLYVAAEGKDATEQATRYTASVYRYVMQN